MWLPPARIVATNVSTLRPGRDPPARPTSRTDWLTSASRPTRCISVPVANKPALATRFGSSKVTSIRSIPRDTPLTESASPADDGHGFRHRHRPSPGRLFRGYAALSQLPHRWIEAQSIVDILQPPAHETSPTPPDPLGISHLDGADPVDEGVEAFGNGAFAGRSASMAQLAKGDAKFGGTLGLLHAFGQHR